MIPRFFCPQPLPREGMFTLPPEVAHHADKVLRMQVGELITLFDGGGGEVSARLVSLRRPASVELLGWSEPQRESALRLVLVQALASADKMDWVIQKAVELGAARVVPLLAERCVLKLSGERAEKRLRHWQRIVASACEQCGRNTLPAVDSPLALGAYLGSSEGARRLFLLPQATQRLTQLDHTGGAIELMVGPEGGWSENELLALEAAGVQSVALGPRVLRTETAGLAALASLQAICGDF